MARTNYPNTSFINLFNAIVYDKDTIPNYSLDIWDAYVIKSEIKGTLTNFQLHNVKVGDTWVGLAKLYYGDERLWWIIPLFNDIENPFIIKQEDIFNENLTQLKILSKNIINNMLFTARRQKIINDSSNVSI